MDYPVESFTEAERAALAPHFTNLDGPVFALTGLPETVKGALFARYSRYPGTLRRLFLDEFAGEIAAPASGTDPTAATGESPTPPPPAAPTSSIAASSWATATTRWPSSAARTWPASGSPT